MATIDKTYFKGEIVIPNINKVTVDETVNLFIEREDERFLIDLLGDELYQLMKDNESTEPYKSLIEGADFEMEYLGRTLNLHWNGLKNSEKKSPNAFYIYCKYRESKNSGFTGAVETQGKKENTMVISPRAKIVNAWNLMVNLRGEVSTYFQPYSDPAGYPIYNGKPTAYNYLLANVASFPKWVFTPLNYMNVLGI